MIMCFTDHNGGYFWTDDGEFDYTAIFCRIVIFFWLKCRIVVEYSFVFLVLPNNQTKLVLQLTIVTPFS